MGSDGRGTGSLLRGPEGASASAITSRLVNSRESSASPSRSPWEGPPRWRRMRAGRRRTAASSETPPARCHLVYGHAASASLIRRAQSGAPLSRRAVVRLASRASPQRVKTSQRSIPTAMTAAIVHQRVRVIDASWAARRSKESKRSSACSFATALDTAGRSARLTGWSGDAGSGDRLVMDTCLSP